MREPPVSSERSRLMSKVRQKDTKPEMLIRRLLHALQYRYRLHQRTLPGSPDLVFPSRRKVLFVHGCFWHRHAGCVKTTSPKTRKEFWKSKFAANQDRDRRNNRKLEALGWDVGVIWECETQDVRTLARKLRKFLGPAGQFTK
jgi:DNA mismatch endonuclease, patch repair protein